MTSNKIYLGEFELKLIKDTIDMTIEKTKEWKDFKYSFVYNTNKIEGNLLSQKQAYKILDNPKEYEKSKEWMARETLGLYRAIQYAKDYGEDSLPLTKEFILELHKITFEGSKSFAGQLRQCNVRIGNHLGTDWRLLDEELDYLIKQYNKIENKVLKNTYYQTPNTSDYNPLFLTTFLHNEFEMIHPFEDGNGRTGRLLLNYVCAKHDLPPINITYEHRYEYYNALINYHQTRDVKPMCVTISNQWKREKTID